MPEVEDHRKINALQMQPSLLSLTYISILISAMLSPIKEIDDVSCLGNGHLISVNIYFTATINIQTEKILKQKVLAIEVCHLF